MDFFPPDPPEQDEDELETPEMELDPRWSPPADQVAVIVPIGEALAVTDTAAIVVSHARVFANGVEIVMERRTRKGSRTRREWERLQWQSHGFPGDPDPDRLRYGMALGDGQHLILDGPRWPEEGDGHSLVATGGNGSGGQDTTLNTDGMWLWPLPPEGPLEIVAQWPAEGVPESRVVLDGGALRARAADSRPIWG